MDVLKRNHVNVRGKGTRPMMFSHGFGCDQRMWRLVHPDFEVDHRVVLFDHVGAGGSDLDAFSEIKYDRLEGYADDVLEICATLDLRDVIFVGHSVSAMIGALAAIKAPELFSDLIMVGPSPCYLNDGDYAGGFSEADLHELLETLDANYLGWSSAMAPVIMGNPDRPELGEELTASFCRTRPDIARHFARTTFLSDYRGVLDRVVTPTLILQCADDVIAPIAVGEYMKRRLPGSQMAILDVAGHCPNLSAPAQTVKATRDYLEARASA